MNHFDDDAALDDLLNTTNQALLAAVEAELDLEVGLQAVYDAAPIDVGPDSLMTWEERHPDATGADLRSADLSHALLTGYHLAGADLTGANLHRASLGGADLTQAVLAHADLSRATLIGTRLTDAVLARADLSRTRLMHATLRRADLRRADLYEADLTGASLIGTNLLEANLAGTNLVGVRWSLDTDWPPPFYQSIRIWSEEVDFGIFMVRADYARDLTPLPELQPL
ncbi:pentapeptide repeat-containing protein [Streptomyces sp. Q6]|uniref:Pentapeptide repeat-containing protein n=1 Tax=Streptomyces citrinus TaxID=3118173 RepID=A0ACD5A5D2_9ACTN